MKAGEFGIEFYRDIYQREMSRRDSIDKNLSLVTTGVTALILSSIFVILSGKLDMEYTASKICIVSAVSCLLFCGLSIVNLTSAVSGRNYHYLDYPDLISDFENKLISHHGNKKLARKEFKDYLLSEYIRCASHNSRQNDQKAYEYDNAKRWLLWSIYPFLVSGASFVVSVLQSMI